MASLGLSSLLLNTLAATLGEGRSYAEVAAAEGVTVEAIRRRAHRARTKARAAGVVIPRRKGAYLERCVSDQHSH